MDPACELARLLERRRDFAPRLLDLRPRLRIVVQPLFQEAQLERERDEPLLCPVVEVPLQPLSLLAGRFDDPCPGPAKLFEPSTKLHMKLGVLESDGRSGRHGLEELRLLLQRRVMQERCDGFATAIDHRHRAVAAGIGKLDRAAVVVGVAPEFGQPVDERK